MHTKYRVSTENTYMGPIASVPDSLFVSIQVWLNVEQIVNEKIFCMLIRLYWSNRIRFVYYLYSIQKSVYKNTSTPIEQTGNDENNNFKCKLFTSEYYGCWLESPTNGEIRFYAGHHKHTFTTSNLPIVSLI